MTAKEMVQQAELEVKAGANKLDVEVTGGYAGDLISAVMTNAEEGNIWITWHVHQNIVAAALVAKLAAIVLVDGREPDEETTRKAEEEGIPILVSKLPAFETIGKLHGMGILSV
jgi:predicted transcriptional regulator